MYEASAIELRAPPIASSIAGKAAAPSISGSIALPDTGGRSTICPTSRASGVKCVPGSLSGNCASPRWRTMRPRMRAARRSTRFTPSSA